MGLGKPVADGPTPPTLAGYQVEELVGVGGTGEVWRARDVLTGRVVALKRLRHDGPPAERDRLRREAAVLAGLSSPHLVRLVTVATSADGLVLVLDYQAGGSLASLLHTRPVLAPGEVVTIAAPLAAALAEVHRLGMVHGDVSPANILFAADGRPVLSDLGVARLVSGRAAAALTTEFADPAVLDGAPFTPASDVYALAAVCYAALAGQPPEADASLRPPLSAVVPAVPWALAEAVESALAADVADRPDASTFAKRLLEAASAAPVRLAGATVPVESPPTAAVRRLPAPSPAPEPVPSRLERAAARLGRWRLSPRRLVAIAAAPVALAAAVWGGVAWARSSSAGAPAWSAQPAVPAGAATPSLAGPSTARSAALTDVLAPTPASLPSSSPQAPTVSAGPLGRPGAPDPHPGPAAGTGATATSGSAGSPRPGVTPVVPEATEAPSVHRRPGGGASATSPGPAAGTGAAPQQPRGTTAPARRSDTVDLTAALRRLDSLRDRAFTSGLPALLDEVYAAGSAPLAEDRSRLAALAAAGSRPEGLSLRVQRVRVLARSSAAAELLVTDTLSAYDLVRETGDRVHVPGRGEVTWHIRLVETAAGWRIDSVSRAAAAPTAAASQVGG